MLPLLLASLPLALAATTTIDDADTSTITYTGSWTHTTDASGSTISYSSAAGAAFSVVAPAGATGVTIHSSLKDDRGAFEVYVDGKVQGKGTEYTAAAAETGSRSVWKGSITDGAKHTYKVVSTAAGGKYLALDAVEIAGVAATVDPSSYYYGGNSYYLQALSSDSRAAVLDAMQAAGMQFIRIFIQHVTANNKNSDNADLVDIEPSVPGTYDDTQLEAIDELMYEASQRGIKLLIAIHNRYMLGWFDTDAYAYHYGISSDSGSGYQDLKDASPFYSSSDAATMIDQRITHVLNHQNSKMGNKAWKDLSEGIFAFEPQNEPYGYTDVVNDQWVCDRATTIKNLVGSSGIYVTTGGGVSFTESAKSYVAGCSAVDIESAHDYGTSGSTAVSALQALQSQTGKPVLFEEWGAQSGKADMFSGMVGALKDAGLPWSVWEVMTPNNPSDYETFTDDTSAWAALAAGGNAQSTKQSAEKASGKSKAQVKAASKHAKGKKHGHARRSQGARRLH